MEAYPIPALKKRRRYTADFKSGLIAACREPVAAVVTVARAHQLDPNLLRRWLREAGVSPFRRQALSAHTPPTLPASPAFVPVTALPSPMSQTEPTPLEVTRGKTCLSLVAAPGSGLAHAIHYLLRRWSAFAIYAETGHLPMDNNPIENAIQNYRPGPIRGLMNCCPSAGRTLPERHSCCCNPNLR